MSYVTITSGANATVPAGTKVTTDTVGTAEIQGVRTIPTQTATGTSVSASATSVTLLSASATRRGFRIFNDSSSAVLYVKYGTTASTTDFTDYLLPGDHLFEEHYSGRVDGIWSAASGAARITDLTHTDS